MKTICVLLLLVAVANAYSIEALKEMMREIKRAESHDSANSMTLREYLDNLETPDPYYKVSAKRSMVRRVDADCPYICGEPAQLDTGIECSSGKWRPEYELNGECECLTRYRCCNEVCKPAKLESCWGEDDSKKGFLYGVKELDCCGCEAVKCPKCSEPSTEDQTCPRGDGARPPTCYTYTQNADFEDDAEKCYRSGCVENESDAPKDLECDSRCQATDTATSPCLFSYGICQPSINKEDCPRRLKQKAIDDLILPVKCYHEPTQVADEAGGHYFDLTTKDCEKCLKWVYEAKSCATKDAAAAATDCHKFGADQMDKKCFLKQTTQDDCKCDVAECIANPVDDAAVMPVDNICPKMHVRVSGVSICMKPRDLCKQCSVVIPIDASDCPIGEVLQKGDCNGCPQYVCQPPAIDAVCACGRYTYVKESNTMVCDCNALG